MKTTLFKFKNTPKEKTKPKKSAGGKSGLSPSSDSVEEYPARDMIYVSTKKDESKKFLNH